MEISWSILTARGLICLDVGKGMSCVDFEKKYKRLYPPCIAPSVEKAGHTEFERTQMYSIDTFDFGELLNLLCQEEYCRQMPSVGNSPILYFITRKGKERISRKK